MEYSTIKTEIEQAWEARTRDTTTNAEKAVKATLELLDKGKIRVAEKSGDKWLVNDWVKKAILLSFVNSKNGLIESQNCNWFDKVKLKFSNWGEQEFVNAGIRAVPGSVVRYSSFIGSGVILMPSFVNVGAYIDSGTMIDTWATVGSCAQIGKNCHISGGTGIGGVLEPLQSNPVIIEDNCFIGARSEIAEGVIVREGSVISMGVFIGASTKIYNRETGVITHGEVPPYSVVVPGSLPAKENPQMSLSAAIIVKTVDEKTRSKTSINELLRM